MISLSEEEKEMLLCDTVAWNRWRRKQGKFKKICLKNMDKSCLPYYTSGLNLRNAVWPGANLKEAYLSGINLQGANLANACLEKANLAGANLEQADLSGANLKQAYLQNTRLSEANLSRADLSGANLFYSDLRYVDFEGAILGKRYSDKNIGYLLLSILSGILLGILAGCFMEFKLAALSLILAGCLWTIMISIWAKNSDIFSFFLLANVFWALTVSVTFVILSGGHLANFFLYIGKMSGMLLLLLLILCSVFVFLGWIIRCGLIALGIILGGALEIGPALTVVVFCLIVIAGMAEATQDSSFQSEDFLYFSPIFWGILGAFVFISSEKIQKKLFDYENQVIFDKAKLYGIQGRPASLSMQCQELDFEPSFTRVSLPFSSQELKEFCQRWLESTIPYEFYKQKTNRELTNPESKIKRPNYEQLRLLIESSLENNGFKKWNEWRALHPESKIDLRRANLSFISLKGANLARANLFRSHIRR